MAEKESEKDRAIISKLEEIRGNIRRSSQMNTRRKAKRCSKIIASILTLICASLIIVILVYIPKVYNIFGALMPAGGIYGIWKFLSKNFEEKIFQKEFPKLYERSLKEAGLPLENVKGKKK